MNVTDNTNIQSSVGHELTQKGRENKDALKAESSFVSNNQNDNLNTDNSSTAVEVNHSEIMTTAAGQIITLLQTDGIQDNPANMKSNSTLKPVPNYVRLRRIGPASYPKGKLHQLRKLKNHCVALCGNNLGVLLVLRQKHTPCFHLKSRPDISGCGQQTKVQLLIACGTPHCFICCRALWLPKRRLSQRSRGLHEVLPVRQWAGLPRVL